MPNWLLGYPHWSTRWAMLTTKNQAVQLNQAVQSLQASLAWVHSVAVQPPVVLAGPHWWVETEMPIAKEATSGWLAAWLAAEYRTYFQHRWLESEASAEERRQGQGVAAFLLKVHYHRHLLTLEMSAALEAMQVELSRLGQVTPRYPTKRVDYWLTVCRMQVVRLVGPQLPRQLENPRSH